MFNDDILIKIVILLLLSGVFILFLRSMEYVVLFYIALRSFFAIFYNVDIMGGFNVLKISGFIFPFLLFLYWISLKFKPIEGKIKQLYFIIGIWVFISTLIVIENYGFNGVQSFNGFFRILNGLSAFIVFPLIFRDQRSIERLTNAFLFATFFPLIQGLGQIVIGVNIGGMESSLTRGEASGDYIMLYGFYDKYDGYAWAALLGGLLMIYKLGTTVKRKKLQNNLFNLLFILYLVLASITLSRTLFISMLIISIFILLAQKSKFQTIITVLLICVFISSSFFGEQFDQIINRSKGEFDVITGNAAIEFGLHGRVSLWQYKLNLFEHSSLLERVVGTNITVGPHSDYINWLLQYGYIGVTLYISLLLSLLVATIRAVLKIDSKQNLHLRSYGLMVIAGIIIFAVEGFVHNPSQYPDYSYFIIGNAAIFLSMSKNRSNKEISSSFRVFPASAKK